MAKSLSAEQVTHGCEYFPQPAKLGRQKWMLMVDARIKKEGTRIVKFHFCNWLPGTVNTEAKHWHEVGHQSNAINRLITRLATSSPHRNAGHGPSNGLSFIIGCCDTLQGA